MKQFHIEKIIMGHAVTAVIEQLGRGVSVRIFGGELSHIGAVSTADENGRISTITLPGHRETLICEEWAEDIYRITKEPVCVTAGIHYDDLTAEELAHLLGELASLKSELLQEFQGRRAE